MTTQAILYQDLPPQTEEILQEQQPSKRRRRMKRESSSEKRTGIRLTPRDLEIFQDLMTTHYMTAPQIQALYWKENRGGTDGQIVATRRRLRLCFEAGLLRRIEPLIRYSSGHDPLLYALDKAGAQVLADQLGIELSAIDYKAHERESNWPFLQHLLDTTDIRIRITQAAAVRGLQVATWYNELELRSEDVCDVVSLTDPNGAQHKAAVVPDALFCLQNAAGKQVWFQLEVDKRTVTVEPNPNNWAKRGWLRKIRTYLAYAESEPYKQRYGSDVVHVLTVTTGDVRLAHLKAATEQVTTTSKRFWFTTFDQLTAETVLSGNIWLRSNLAGLHPLLG